MSGSTANVNIASVSGPGVPALATPVDISAFAYQNLSGTICSNVYGVPWIIGAKKGFPSFNEFYDLNLVQVSRLLQVNRARTNSYVSSNYTTNEMFIMSITNTVGMSSGIRTPPITPATATSRSSCGTT